LDTRIKTRHVNQTQYKPSVEVVEVEAAAVVTTTVIAVVIFIPHFFIYVCAYSAAQRSIKK
jgi:hypothetical protein